jgi:hypothetical protein
LAQTDKVVRFVLRLPPDLHDRLKALAARERRSLHSQILYLLQRAIDADQEEKAAA